MPKRLILDAVSTVVVKTYEEVVLDPGQIRLSAVSTAISGGTEQMTVAGRAPRTEFSWDDDQRLLAPRSDSGFLYPVGLGYQFAGRITELGPGVGEPFEVGDLYWVDAPHAETLTLQTSSLPPMRRVEVKPAWHAAYVPMARIALGAVHDARPLIGDHVTVFGAGMIGLLSGVLVARAGAASVTVVEPGAHRRRTAESLGFEVIDPAQESPGEALQDRGCRADIVIEASGTYSALREAMRAARTHGTVVCVSSYGNQSSGITMGHEFHRNRLTVLSSMTVNGCAHRDAPRWDLDRLTGEAVRLIEAESLRLDELGVDVMPFERAPDAYEQLKNRDTAPVAIRFEYCGAKA